MRPVSLTLGALGTAAALALAGCGRATPEARAAEHGAHAGPAGASTDTGMAGMDGMPGMAMPGAGATPITASAADRTRLGILVTTSAVRDLVRDVRLVGRVVPAETAQRTVTSRVDGFVERLWVDFTGRPVRRGEALLDLYSPTLVAAQQELLLAVRLRGALGQAPTPDAAQNADSLVAAARRRLEFWDISDDQIDELERTGAARRTLTLRSPSDGVVLEKNVVQGQAVAAGAPLFQIADLSTVWLEADAFEEDLAAVRVGQQAEVGFDAYPGEVVRGRVSYVYPTVDPASRTGKVRIALANPGDRFRPGLFGTVHIVSPLGVRGVVIPRQAALVTGDRQLVFVEDSAGRFVPRLVTLGVETDSLVQVREGLRAGERVVATAAFLLDAESNLGAAMAGMAGMDMGPSGGAKAAPAAPAAQAPRPAAPAPADPHAGHAGHTMHQD